jgi:hypothetical protein
VFAADNFGKYAPILHFLISRLQRVPKARFLSLIKKAHFAFAINAWLIDAPHRIFVSTPGTPCCGEWYVEVGAMTDGQRPGGAPAGGLVALASVLVGPGSREGGS